MSTSGGSVRRTSLAIAAAVGVLSASIMLAPPALAQRAARFERENLNGREAVAHEVLVKFRDPLQPPELDNIAAQANAQSVEPIGTTGTLRLRSRSQSAAALIQALSRRPDVVYAEPNWIIQIASVPDDSWVSELWGLDRIRAIPAWDLTVGSTSSVVGVIDTGIDYTHPDLAANVWSAPTPFSVTVGGDVIHCGAGTHGFNAITRQCNPMDDENHGTHVSGTIGAVGNNGMGVAGVNWTAQLMGLKFLDEQGTGTIADAIVAVEFAIAVKQAFQATGDAQVRVLSASWGGPDFSQALLDQVQAANDADMLFVAAAGNSAGDNDILPMYPAAFDAPNIVAVAASSFGDNLAAFSNYGASSVHLAAPGEFILSTTIGNGYGYSSGTSMAAPHVSGAAALVLSRCSLDTATLKDTLLGTVDYLTGLTNATVTGGRLNVNSALHACTAPPAAPSELTARGANMTVTLSWSSVPGAMRYRVKRSLTAGGPYTLLASDVKATTYIDTAVVNGTTYYYVVSAENTLGESGDSNEASATPSVPADLIVSAFTTPGVGGAGSTIAVSVTTSNPGAGVAQSSVTRIYLSVNWTFDASDPLLAVVPVPELAPGMVAAASLSVPIPEDTNVGSYYLIAGVDADNTLDESNESNNSLSRSIQIGPDLVVDTITAPSAGAAGGTIAITDSTHNRGGGAAAAAATTFYLSVNSMISADDVVLGSRAVPAVAAGATNTGTTTLTIPGTTAAGAYYIVAKADGNDLVAETTEANNTSLRTIQIGGDLVVSALAVPATGAPGAPIVVTDTTTNQGAALVGVSKTRFYLSTNAMLDAADTLLAGGRDVSALGPGAGNSGPTTLTLPTSLATAGYYIIAKADDDGGVPETSETNNTYARAIQIGGDLLVSTLTVPATGGAGLPVTISDTTRNQGAGPVGPSVTKFYLSTNASFDTADTLLASREVPGLASGAASTAATTAIFPSNVPTGTYYVIARADADGGVVETNESNNSVPRSVKLGSDLVIGVFSTPVKAAAGSLLGLSETVTNQGGGPSTPSVTRYYLSTDWTLDAADVLLGGGRDVSALAPGGSSTGSTSVMVPAGTAPGMFYVIAKADGDNTVGETSEANNTNIRTVGIGPDLTVWTSVPSSAAAGTAINVTDTVTNQGADAAAQTVTRFYLSKNVSLDALDIVLGPGRGVPNIAAGTSNAGTTAVTIPSSTAVGSYYLLVKADGDNAVGESSETNNVSARAIQVTTAP